MAVHATTQEATTNDPYRDKQGRFLSQPPLPLGTGSPTSPSASAQITPTPPEVRPVWVSRASTTYPTTARCARPFLSTCRRRSHHRTPTEGAPAMTTTRTFATRVSSRRVTRLQSTQPGATAQPRPPPHPHPRTPTQISIPLFSPPPNNFGRPAGKPKVGLAGYCASLRDTRPQDFAALVTKALARRQFAQRQPAAAIPITVEFATCPSNYFIPGEEARACGRHAPASAQCWSCKHHRQRPRRQRHPRRRPRRLTFSDTDPDDAG